MKLDFEKSAYEDFQYWIKNDKKKALKILQLLEDIEIQPFSGLGKPEPLKSILAVFIIIKITEAKYNCNIKPQSRFCCEFCLFLNLFRLLTRRLMYCDSKCRS
ncbi:MAG: type II toxin-antitoxin system YoeB family toxin [Spirochaetes bacterium]|nr:type II toxin-antitoxin system YoeB family toxin [Spirochaetota bacterium]